MYILVINYKCDVQCTGTMYMYVVKDLVKILTYRYTLEHILVKNLINVIYVVKNVVRIVTYRDTLEHKQLGLWLADLYYEASYGLFVLSAVLA
jgi:hypothetical protein